MQTQQRFANCLAQLDTRTGFDACLLSSAAHRGGSLLAVFGDWLGDSPRGFAEVNLNRRSCSREDAL